MRVIVFAFLPKTKQVFDFDLIWRLVFFLDYYATCLESLPLTFVVSEKRSA
jgi:hypothetical protein